MIRLIIATSLLFSVSAQAAVVGYAEIQGKLLSFDQKTAKIENPTAILKVPRSLIPKSVKMETGKPVHFAIVARHLASIKYESKKPGSKQPRRNKLPR